MTITVIDDNDHTPEFVGEPLHVVAQEGSLGRVLIRDIDATDMDSGANGEIRFQITGGNIDGSFYIDANTVSSCFDH